MRARKVSTNSRISAITEYSFQLRVCLLLIYAVFFPFTPFTLVSNSINWRVNQFFGYLCLPRKKKNAIKLYEFQASADLCAAALQREAKWEVVEKLCKWLWLLVKAKVLLCVISMIN